MTGMVKRGIFLLVLLLTVSLLTIYFTVDFNSFASLRNINGISILLALFCLAIGLYFDGLRLQRMVRMTGVELPVRATLQVIAGNYFMAMLTPGATGGAVAQVLMLKNFGVSMAVASSLVLIRTMFSIFFLVFMLPFIFSFDYIDIPYVSRTALIYLSFVGVLATGLVIYLLKRRKLKELLFFLLPSKYKAQRKNFLHTLHQLNEGFSLLYKNPWQTLIVFLESAVSLLFLYSIVPALIWAFSSHVPVIELLNRMIVLNLILYFAPTPGGAGVAEGLFLYFFIDYVPPGTVGIIAVAWRVIAEYIPFFLGMYGMITFYGRKYFFN